MFQLPAPCTADYIHQHGILPAVYKNKSVRLSHDINIFSWGHTNFYYIELTRNSFWQWKKPNDWYSFLLQFKLIVPCDLPIFLANTVKKCTKNQNKVLLLALWFLKFLFYRNTFPMVQNDYHKKKILEKISPRKFEWFWTKLWQLKILVFYALIPLLGPIYHYIKTMEGVSKARPLTYFICHLDA